MGEIKNYYMQAVDVITILPIVELYTCKHQLCVTCLRKIAQRGRDKRVECPMCRRKSSHFNVYNVNRNSVDVLKCSVVNVRERKHLNVDAASLARNLLEQSLIDVEPAADDCFKPSELQIVINQLQTQIDAQTKLNYNLQLQSNVLEQTVNEVNERLNKIKNDYNEFCKLMYTLCDKKLREERALKLLIDKHAQWIDKNIIIESENKRLTNENVVLIRDNNLFIARKHKGSQSH